MEFWGSKEYKLKAVLFSAMSVGSIVIVSIKLGGVLLAVLGILLLPLVIIFAYPRYKYPILKIDKNTITTRSLFGKPVVIDDLTQYKLVVSKDFLAFRHNNENDVMLDQENFNKYQYSEVLDYLKALPFNEIITSKNL